MKKPSQRSTIEALDLLARCIVRERDCSCQRCGKTPVQVAHVFSRRNRAVRWDLDNLIGLCVGCHLFWAHKEPVLFNDFVREKLGEKRFEALKMRARAVSEVDLKAVEIYLRSELAKVEGIVEAYLSAKRGKK